MSIDAHQHFWHPARGDYSWMPPDDPVLTRPYGPADLEQGLRATGVRQTVLVQAAPSVAETEYMLGIADATPHVAGVVGWIDFEDPAQRADLERLAAHPRLKGIRPMIQDIPDVDWMLRPDLAWAFDALTESGLVFDALGFPRHLDPFLTLVQRHPDLKVVVDHCMKPQIRDGWPQGFDAWAPGIARIARDTSACCKLSGIVTEANAGVSAEDLEPYVAHVLEVFGPDRVLWGSDWPVLRLRQEYQDWHAMARDLVGRLAPGAEDRIFEATARRVYGLPAPQEETA